MVLLRQKRNTLITALREGHIFKKIRDGNDFLEEAKETEITRSTIRFEINLV